MAGASKEEYLEAIYGILEDGRKARTKEIAHELKVKQASVSEMLGKLDADGYIRHRPYHGVELTGKGRRMGAKVKRKHRLLERFLHDVLKIRKSRVHDEACLMEHTLSDEAADALEKFMKHPKVCPDDGKPIPPAKGASRNLTHLLEGESSTVKALNGGDLFMERMRTIGIKEGKRVKVVAKEPLGGPVVVRVGNTKVTIGRGMAKKVVVK